MEEALIPPRTLLEVEESFSILVEQLSFSYGIPAHPAYDVVRRFRSVVDANLTIVGIADMPVFVITIIYGLFSQRTNWQGAVGGYFIPVSWRGKLGFLRMNNNDHDDQCYSSAMRRPHGRHQHLARGRDQRLPGRAIDPALWGARQGLRGLVSGDWVDLTDYQDSVDERARLEFQPGAALGSGRSRLAEEDMPRALDFDVTAGFLDYARPLIGNWSPGARRF